MKTFPALFRDLASCKKIARKYKYTLSGQNICLSSMKDELACRKLLFLQRSLCQSRDVWQKLHSGTTALPKHISSIKQKTSLYQTVYSMFLEAMCKDKKNVIKYSLIPNYLRIYACGEHNFWLFPVGIKFVMKRKGHRVKQTDTNVITTAYQRW